MNMCDFDGGGGGVGEEDDATEKDDCEPLPNDDYWALSESEFFTDPNFFNDINLLLADDDGVDVAEEPVVSNKSGAEVVDDAPKSRPEVENNDKAAEDCPEDEEASKKRKRQEKNRDAAVRSRERKKQYVKDLEMKSCYFEGECQRLGMLYNYVLAENRALRFSLQSSKAIGASVSKQESAVLLLESLLLGSLLWFLVTICLLDLPEGLLPTKEEILMESVDNRSWGSQAPRMTKSKNVEVEVFHSFMKGKRCKASRSRMKSGSLLLLQVWVDSCC